MEAHGITSPSIDKPTFDTDDLCSAQEMHNWREKTFATASRVMFFLILPAWFFSIIQANNYLWYAQDFIVVSLIALSAFATRSRLNIRINLFLGVLFFEGVLWL